MNPESPEQTPPKKELTKKQWLVIGGAVGITVIVGVLFIVLITQNSTPQGSKIHQVQHKGYENVADSIADPAPLSEETNANVVTFSVEPVIPACSIATIDDLKKINLLIAPKTLAGAHTRTFFDGQGAKNIDLKDDLNLPTEASNSCQYALHPVGNIQLTVYQPAYTNAKALQREINRRYTPQTPIHGVQVFSRNADNTAKDTQTFAYFLQKDTVTVELSLQLAKDSEAENTKQHVLETIATGLYKPPSGPSTITYKSPVFTQSFLNACSITEAKDLTQLFNEEATPYMQEQLATAIGIINFSLGTHIKDANEYAFINHVCSRDTVQAPQSNKKGLRITTQSYTSNEAAKHSIELGKQKDEGQAAPAVIADDSYVVGKEYARAKGVIVFRKGRLVVEVRLEDSKNPSSKADPSARAQLLLPVAQAIAGRIKE